MTAQGRTTVEEAAPAHVSFVREAFFDSLNKTERSALESALPKILASLEQQGLKDGSC